MSALIAHHQRILLPPRRKSQVLKVKIAEHSLFLTWGVYPDGRLGEIFLDMHKYGTSLREWLTETAMVFSLSLQYGVPLASLVGLYAGTRGDPSGRVVGHPYITSCTSVMDFVARFLAEEFPDELEQDAKAG